MANKTFRTISVMNTDYEYFDKVKTKWTEKNTASISMPQVLKLAMADLDKKLAK